MNEDSTNKQIVRLRTDDGTELVATEFRPRTSPHTALLINSGTGIPQRFYGRFASAAAEQGFVVLTYDYRGIAESAPISLKGYQASYRDWGQQDMPAAIDWLCQTCPQLPLTVVGHSTGGQQLGLAHNYHQVQAAVFVAVSTGYWRGMPWRYKWLSLFLWKFYMPVTSRMYGYAPSQKIGWGENLPVGVAREWGAWCQEPRYLAAFFDDGGHRRSPDGRPFGGQWFDDVRFPIRSLCFSDDPIATPANVPPLLSLYRNSNIDSLWFDPKSLGVPRIGHLDFFRRQVGGSLWPDTLDWLRQTAQARIQSS